MGNNVVCLECLEEIAVPSWVAFSLLTLYLSADSVKRAQVKADAAEAERRREEKQKDEADRARLKAEMAARLAADMAEADRLAKEKAEADRVAKEKAAAKVKAEFVAAEAVEAAAEAKRKLPWTGWYQQEGAQHPVCLDGFKITKTGHIEGDGSDDAGEFTFCGNVNKEKLTMEATKNYPDYKVYYGGSINEEQTLIKGHWGW